VTSKTRQVLGWFAVFGSAFCFYLATASIRWSAAHVSVDPAYFVFGRFLLGFLTVCAVLGANRKPLRPRRFHLLIGRTVANCIAVYCFYKAVDVTSVAEANILNMTYPVFIALFSWIFLKEQRDPVAAAMVGVAFIGVWLVLSPGRIGLEWGNLWGLGSGFSAAFAIVYLNISRQCHDSNTILFYMFGLGSIIIFLVFRDRIFYPGPAEFHWLFLCSALGIAGQYLLTLGFRYVTAVEGAIISSTRILLAALLGPVIAGDPALTWAGGVGAFLIFMANVLLAARRARGRAAAASPAALSASGKEKSPNPSS
jgi:drug/metabolite transporter (DMT)-like permease